MNLFIELEKLYRILPKEELRALMALYEVRCSDEALTILEGDRKEPTTLKAYAWMIRLLTFREELLGEITLAKKAGVC